MSICRLPLKALGIELWLTPSAFQAELAVYVFRGH